MSRTFEMLQRLEKEQEFGLSPSLVALAPPVKVEHNGSKSVRVGDEEVLKLVQRIFRTSGPEAPRLVVFSAVGHGDGATWISTNAATTLAAQSTASICVVDANLRTPSLHNYFDMENRVGWAEAISQPGTLRTFAQQIGGSNLWVITSGSPESARSLSSEGLRTRMADLRAEFDYVLIDAPPANLYADAISLGRLSDGIILVLQSNTTRREAALKAKESFEAANVRLLGAVLNKRTFPIPQNLYDRLQERKKHYRFQRLVIDNGIKQVLSPLMPQLLHASVETGFLKQAQEAFPIGARDFNLGLTGRSYA